MDVQTQVIKFFTGQTANNNTKYDVYFADGSKASAFDYAIGSKAEQAFKSGETVIAHITEKPNPNGPTPYRNLVGITLGVAGAPVAPSGDQSSISIPAGPQRGSYGGGGGMTPEDKIRVTKLSCISSAAAIFSGSGDVKTTLEASVEIFNAIWKQPEEVVAVPADPVAVTEFVNAEAGAPVVQVGTEKPALPWAVA